MCSWLLCLVPPACPNSTLTCILTPSLVAICSFSNAMLKYLVFTVTAIRCPPLNHSPIRSVCFPIWKASVFWKAPAGTICTPLTPSFATIAFTQPLRGTYMKYHRLITGLPPGVKHRSFWILFAPRSCNNNLDRERTSDSAIHVFSQYLYQDASWSTRYVRLGR